MPDIPGDAKAKHPTPGGVGNIKKRPDMTWRDHLVMLLMSGAEVEHALMVQYLYAAYSLNGNQGNDHLDKMIEGWRASLLSVAREEMGHLLTVQNVVVLLGAPINFERQMTPWDHEYYPFPFSLEPLTRNSLQCYLYAEMPRLESLAKPAPGIKLDKKAEISIDKQKEVIEEITGELSKRYDPGRVDSEKHRVGELYDQIIALISDTEKIPESEFNEATYEMQAAWDDWGRGYGMEPRPLDPEGDRIEIPVDPHAAKAKPSDRDAIVQVDRAATRTQAVKILRALAAQGEAPHLIENETGEPSHFERFVEIYEDLKRLEDRDPAFRATFAVPNNPTTRDDFVEKTPNTTLILANTPGDPPTPLSAHLFAQLFNQRYRLLLTYLAHSFRLARTERTDRPSLRGMVMHRAFGEMYNLKTIAGLLVRLPMKGHGADGGDRAGPPFEMPYSLELPRADRDVWRIYDDLLKSTQYTGAEIFRLANDFPDMLAELEQIGADAYVRSLMSLDARTRLWVGQILAAAA